MIVEQLDKPTVAIMKEIKIFQSFSDEELEAIISLGTTATYEPHTNIIIEGELSWGFYVILSGIIGVYKNNKLTGTSFDLGHLRPGNFFGEMSLIDDDPRSASIRALTGAHLFYLSKESFLTFVSKSTDLKMRFFSNCIHTLVKRLRELNDDYVVSQYQVWQSIFKKDGKSK